MGCIIAANCGSEQVGMGCNDECFSSAFGCCLRLNYGDMGPSMTRNGDIYVNSMGCVMIYSNSMWKCI
tara:strand:- start:22 stop:225 length:204 start_codon:yes stop_codon:yes gene_type:complete